MSGQPAKFTGPSEAFLNKDFGYDFAVRYFGQEAIDALPKITRGPNVGRPKGYIVWQKVISGGYVRESEVGGYIENRRGACVNLRIIIDGKTMLENSNRPKLGSVK